MGEDGRAGLNKVDYGVKSARHGISQVEIPRSQLARREQYGAEFAPGRAKSLVRQSSRSISI